MSPSNRDLNSIAKGMDKRKAIFVDEQGRIHDAKKLGERPTEQQRPMTKLKPSTWY